ncbi:MAG: hypothetical protein WCH20_07385 [Nitrospira sp.]|jgi:hypothetical protein
MVWEMQHERLHETMASSDYRTVSQEVDKVLKDAGLPLLARDSIEFKRLCRRLLRAKIELVGIEKKRVHGNYPPRQVHSTASVPPSIPAEKPSLLFDLPPIP